MNKLREDELDAFLWEVETVSKQVYTLIILINKVKDILEGNVDLEKLEEKEDPDSKKDIDLPGHS